jgi:serine/threonine-protein kinase
MSTTIPPKIGRYDVVNLLGQGGMGVVYRARAPEGGEVAVKLLARSLAKPGAFERFAREARLQSGLGEASGFVPLLDAGEVPEGLYLVMPLLTGGSLRSRIEAGQMPIADGVGLARALAAAVGRAHAQGIVHRDLKPENVLFTADGRPLVADLGLAKHFRHDVSGASLSVALSKTGEMRGTAGYMAPEQIGDAAKAGPPADVFALGAILYELVVGAPPFVGESVIELLARTESGSYERLANRRPDAPAWLDALVARALAHDPEQRFADAGALARALEAGQPARGRAPLVAMAGALGALLVAVSVASAIALASAQRARDDAVAARDGMRAERDHVSVAAAAIAGAPLDDAALGDLAKLRKPAERAVALVAAARRTTDKEQAVRLVEAAIAQDDLAVFVDLADEPRVYCGKILSDAAHVVFANKGERDREKLARARVELFRARVLAPRLDLREDARALHSYLSCRGRADLAIVARPHVLWSQEIVGASLDALETSDFPGSWPDEGGGPPVYFDLRRALDQERAWPNAKMEVWNEALLYRPDFDILWMSVAAEALDAGSYAVAVRCYKEYLARQKTSWAHACLGLGLLRIGRYRDAADELEKGWAGSKTKDGCDGYAGCNYIYVCFALGDWVRFDRAMEDVGNSCRDNADIQRLLAILRARANTFPRR